MNIIAIFDIRGTEIPALAASEVEEIRKDALAAQAGKPRPRVWRYGWWRGVPEAESALAISVGGHVNNAVFLPSDLRALMAGGPQPAAHEIETVVTKLSASSPEIYAVSDPGFIQAVRAAVGKTRPPAGQVKTVFFE